MTSAHLPTLPDEISFASELIKARGELGLTQAQLAESSGLSVSAIKAYEAGRNMPGTRELRELCQALQVSPNKLLFGTELPFEARSLTNLLVDGDTDDKAVSRMRLALAADLLSSDERQAVFTLVSSIAIARHGEAKLRETSKTADFLAGMGRTLTKATRDAVVTGREIDPQAVADDLEDFVQKRGHFPAPEKLPKK